VCRDTGTASQRLSLIYRCFTARMVLVPHGQRPRLMNTILQDSMNMVPRQETYSTNGAWYIRSRQTGSPTIVLEYSKQNNSCLPDRGLPMSVCTSGRRHLHSASM
jgi:hypothetical protein